MLILCPEKRIRGRKYWKKEAKWDAFEKRNEREGRGGGGNDGTLAK